MMNVMKITYKKFLVPFVLGLAAMFGITGCGSGSQSQIREPEELCCDSVGAYFITNKSYESYVRNCAMQIGADEQWVSEVLNGGDGGEWHYMIRPKSWFWCAIADNQITVSKIEYNVYDIFIDGNIYQGSSVTETISFWFNGDILYLSDNNETLEFKKDSSYKRAESGAISLGLPQNITVQIGGAGLDYVVFQWEYRPDYGRVGAVIEIKTPGSSEYKTVKKIERVYMNAFIVQLDESKFEVGENWVRIYHIGGPSITNDHSIITNKNSDYASYRIIVNDDGSVQVK